MREGNGVAHHLAKLALTMQGKRCWVEEGPKSISRFALSEMLCND